MEPIFQDVLNRHLGETGMRECHINEPEPTKHNLVCEQCWDGFVAYLGTYGPFCSQECQDEWNKDHEIPCTGCGENHEGDC